jgi:hypothetical protein
MNSFQSNEATFIAYADIPSHLLVITPRLVMNMKFWSLTKGVGY